jgi:hypothetical protein
MFGVGDIKSSFYTFGLLAPYFYKKIKKERTGGQFFLLKQKRIMSAFSITKMLMNIFTT